VQSNKLSQTTKDESRKFTAETQSSQRLYLWKNMQHPLSSIVYHLSSFVSLDPPTSSVLKCAQPTF